MIASLSFSVIDRWPVNLILIHSDAGDRSAAVLAIERLPVQGSAQTGS